MVVGTENPFDLSEKSRSQTSKIPEMRECLQNAAASWRCDGDHFEASAGTTFVVPRGEQHAWIRPPETTSHLLSTFTPGGMDEYFEEVAGRPQDERTAIAKET